MLTMLASLHRFRHDCSLVSAYVLLHVQCLFNYHSLARVDDEDALEAADEAAMALDDTLLNVYEVTRAAQQPRTRNRASQDGDGRDSQVPSHKDLEVVIGC